MIELSAFEYAAIALKERETEVFRGKAELAHYAVEHDKNNVKGRPAANLLAHEWGCSMHSVNVLARIFETFDEDEITPDIPLSLWNAVMETDDPPAWLERAMAEGLSSRQVRDLFGSKKGRHYSDIQFTGDRVEVTTWDPASGDFAVTGMPLSGEMPRVARVTVREALHE